MATAILPGGPTPAGVATPPTQPEPGFEGLEEVSAQPAEEPGFEGLQAVNEGDAGFEGLKEADQLDLDAPEKLAADDNFRPGQYLAENPEIMKDQERLNKLLGVYRQKRIKGLEFGKVAAAAVKEAPGVVGKTLKGAGQLASRTVDIAVSPAVNEILGLAEFIGTRGKSSPSQLREETRKRQLKGAAEITAGTEAAATGLAQLATQGGRKLFGVSPEKATDEELYDQLLVDSEFHKEVSRVAKGEGDVPTALGLNADYLSKNGITLDEKAIENLSLVDPLTLVATGGVFKVVGTGGRIIAQAATRAGAQSVINGFSKLAANTAARSANLAGRAAAATGRAVQKIPLRGASAGAVGAQVISGDVLGAVGAALTPAAVKTGGRLLEKAGTLAAEAGAQLRPGFIGPRSASVTRLAELATGPVAQVAKGAAKGAAAGAALSAPLALAADESQTAGAILGGGTALGGIAGGVHATGKPIANAVAKKYLDPHSIPFQPVDSPGYGIDANLDTAHAEAMKTLSGPEQNAVNNFREAVKAQGGEIYVQDPANYAQRVRETLMQESGVQTLTPEQEALATKYAGTHAFLDGYITDANGNQRRVVFLNNSAKGLPHDAGHLFQALMAPEKQASLRQAVLDSYPPKQLQEFAQGYTQKLGDPQYFSKLGEEAGRNKIADEIIAENFSQLFGNAKLSDLKAPPKFLETLGRTAVEAAETLGIDLTAGRVTPDLNVQPTYRLQNVLRNAAREVLNLPEAEKATPIQRAPTPEPPAPGDIPPVSPEAPVSPAGEIPAVGETPKAPTPDVAAQRAAETGIEVARTLTADKPEAAATVNTIAASMEGGNPALRIEHRGITAEPVPGEVREAGRAPRRGTQARGYEELEKLQIENRKDAPESIVNVHEKTFVPVRWVEQGGKATLIAMSQDKVIANVRRIVSDANAKKAGDLIPYEQAEGKLTDAGWNQAMQDLKVYAENQANGYRGDGQKLVRPAPEAGVSIPAENPNYTPKPLGEAQANFANLVQGIAPPQTARMIKGQVPGNIKGQLVAEANLRKPQPVAKISAKDIQKQTFGKPFEGRTVMETNPLRNELQARGVNTRNLIEVTERLAADDIASVAPAGIEQKAPVTDVIRGGFLPRDAGSVQEFGRFLLESPGDELKPLMTELGGLTEGAWNLGKNLTRREDLAVLKALQAEASERGRALMKEGNFSEASPMIMKGQFFREAYEAATGTGGTALQAKKGRLGPDYKAPFPEQDMQTSFLPAEQFSPELDPIKMAAIRTKGGHIVTGSWHGEAYMKLADEFAQGTVKEPLPEGVKSLTDLLDDIAEVGGPSGFIEDGFVTQSGKFLNRAQALDHAEKIGQMKASAKQRDASSAGVLESAEFGRERSFLPAEQAGAETKQQAEARKAWNEQGTDSPYFQRWFKGSQVVMPKMPSKPQTVYHGTTHEFTEFTKRGANPENDFGEGFYFSSDPDEVGRNYAGEGADLTNRLLERAGRLEFEESLSSEEAMTRAREELKGSHEGAMMPSYLSIKKPFRLGSDVSGTPETVLEVNPRSGKGTLTKFLDNLVEEANRAYEANPEELRAEIMEKANYESIPASELIEALKSSDNLTYATDENGTLIMSELIRRAIEKSGFDGIIDETVSTKFKHMNLAPDAIHYIAFKPEQVKSATGNVGTFSKKEADVRFLPSEKEVTDALSTDKKPFVGAHRELEPGTPVGLRIDIPAYTRHGVYVITVHEKAKGQSQVGKRIGYDSVATVDNPTFFSNERGAEKIKEGAAKFPIATVEGEFNPSREVPTDLEGWAVVGYNPTKHSYFYDKATDQPVVGGEQAVSAGNSVYVKNPVYGEQKDFAFLPKSGTEEFDAYTQQRIEDSKQFPEALPLNANKDAAGHYKSQYAGEPNWITEPWDFNESPLAKENRGKTAAESEELYTDALSKKLMEAYHEAKKNPDIEAGETWYSIAREKIQTLLGDDAQFFAELLGATSPNTAVDVNFGYAVEAYNLFKQGYYDKIIEKYREGKNAYRNGEIEEFSKETGKTGKKATEKAFLTWWAEKHKLEPTSNRVDPKTGKHIKFGFHTQPVMRVLDRSWLQQVEGPKTPNFTGNLSGATFKATIDVWAARLLHRLSTEGFLDKWRIQSPAEQGVGERDFFTGQKAFQKAADKLGIQADALQAILWFFEKDHWEKKGWTKLAGAKKADYNVLLRSATKSPEGQLTYVKPSSIKPKAAKVKVSKVDIEPVKTNIDQ